MSKPRSQSKSPQPSRASREQAAHGKPITISGRWLASAVAIVFGAALLCVWVALCLVFWQGSWQLLYHPTAAVTQTPATAGMAFESVQFDAGADGLPQLSGWWIPGTPSNRFTAIYLHGATGNLGDTIDDLARLHAAGVDVLAFDYRGYGRSKFIHPSEDGWRQDAEAAIAYLRDTRHVSTGSMVLVGRGLGANLALQIAANHSELAGVVLDDPIEAPSAAIFNDPRARLVPARLLVGERWESGKAAATLGIPSLWILRKPADHAPTAFDRVKTHKMLVWLTRPQTAEADFADAFSRWLGELRSNAVTR